MVKEQKPDEVAMDMTKADIDSVGSGRLAVDKEHGVLNTVDSFVKLD